MDPLKLENPGRRLRSIQNPVRGLTEVQPRIEKGVSRNGELCLQKGRLLMGETLLRPPVNQSHNRPRAIQLRMCLPVFSPFPGTGTTALMGTGPMAYSVGPRCSLESIIASHVTSWPVYAAVLPITAVSVAWATCSASLIATSGRFSKGENSWMLAPPVALTQNDIRELQLAKAAIAAGIKLLMQRKGAKELARLYLAGAFGNYIDRASALRIGLIDFPPERVEAAGNTALLGAKLALFSLDSEDGSYAGVRRRVEHVALNADPSFQDVFVEELAFPQARPTN